MSLIIYEHNDFKGEHAHIYQASWFRLYSFAKKISSIQVLSGEYEFYDQEFFEGNLIRLGTGNYPDLDKLAGNWNDKIRSIKRIHSHNINTKGLTIYQHTYFRGTHKHIVDTDVAHLKEAGWNNRIASIQITTGVWKVFSGPGFTGDYAILRPGIYPNASGIGLKNKRIASLQQLEVTDQSPLPNEMIAFSGQRLVGKHKHFIHAGDHNLHKDKWNNKMNSLLVIRGTDWALFNDKTCKGAAVILGEGAYGGYHSEEQQKIAFPLTQVSSVSIKPVKTEIEKKYLLLGGKNSFLGVPITPEKLAEDGHGFFRHYQYGSIYWHPDTSAYAVHGAIHDKWNEMHAEKGVLGYPISDEFDSIDGISKVVHFQRGSVYWNEYHGSFTVSGKIWQKWADLHFEQGPLGHPVSPVEINAAGQTIRFKYGTITWSEAEVSPVRFYTQNMALLVFPGIYPGATLFDPTERTTALDKLISFLQTEKFDFVGLSEIFAPKERKKITEALKDIYIASAEGLDEHDPESNGGLLLLSRHPIEYKSGTIVPPCKTYHCMAQKGVLYARARVEGHPSLYDIFLSHIPNTHQPEQADENKEIINRQLLHINDFISSFRSRDRVALMMGNVGTNMLNPLLNRSLKKALSQPEDVWEMAGDGSKGITRDLENTVNENSFPLAAGAPTRKQCGERSDMILSWKAATLWPCYEKSRVIVLQRKKGKDISNHYGLKTTLHGFDQLSTMIQRSIQRITVSLVKFHCLEKTEDDKTDKMSFSLRLYPDNGPKTRKVTSTIIKNLVHGKLHTFSTPALLHIQDPGDHLQVEITGNEINCAGDNALKNSIIRFSKADLLEMFGQTTTHVLPPLKKSGATYAVYIRIKIE